MAEAACASRLASASFGPVMQQFEPTSSLNFWGEMFQLDPPPSDVEDDS